MQERSLKVLDENKTFFSKISTTISKILIPTRIGINGMLITLKRNALIKSYSNYIDNINNEDVNKKDALFKKYEDAYALYLEAIDKHIMDSVYKKVKNGTASNFEKDALANYYTVISLKDTDYNLYKFKKQKYLLELDYETLFATLKVKNLSIYQDLYIEKMEVIYKGIIKNYAVKLADNLSKDFKKREKIFDNIFNTIEEYMQNILKLKIEKDENSMSKDVLEEFDRYEGFDVGKLDARDIIEKQMILLGISRQIFTHSLPLVVAEQCYIKLLKDLRALIVSVTNEQKREKIYQLFVNLIEEYNIKLLSTKVYWEKPESREEYKKFWDEYKKIANLKKQDVKEFVKEREILFLKYDLKRLNESKHDYRNIIKLHKEKLVNYGEMKTLKNSCITVNLLIGQPIKKKVRV